MTIAMKRKNMLMRWLSVVLLIMAVGTVNATPYKNIYVKLTPTPGGAGTVYMKTDDEKQVSTTGEDGSVEIKATIGENGNEAGNDTDLKGFYECWLYAVPEDGYELVGFTKVLKENVEDYEESDFLVQSEKAGEAVNNHPDGFRVNVNIPRAAEGTNNQDEVRARNDWSATPDHQFYAVFKESDKPVNRVAVSYYKSAYNGYQNNTFGSWESEIIDEGLSVRLKAVPAEGLRLMAWHQDENGNPISTETEITVPNVLSTYSPRFDLMPLTLPAEMSTYSFTKQTNFMTDGDRPTAYIVTAVDDIVTLLRVRHANAGEGVLLQGEAGHTYNEMTYQGVYGLDANHPEDNHSANLLRGSANDLVFAPDYVYMLENGDKGWGFYRKEPDTEIPQGQAYLELEGETRDFIGFTKEDTPTAISTLTDAQQSTPIIYNMVGQRVNRTFNGIVIQNGRKYIHK